MYVSINGVAGHLAMWAVRQSPYPVPENIEAALKGFRANLGYAFGDSGLPMPDPACIKVQDDRTVRQLITKAIDATPEIRAWNERKNGNQAPYNFISRYDGPTDPDNDFIDLGALAGNTTRSLWRELEADKAFDDDFERRWNSWGSRWQRFMARTRARFA